MRCLLFVLFVVSTLNIFTVKIVFKDGLILKSIGWPTKVQQYFDGGIR